MGSVQTQTHPSRSQARSKEVSLSKPELGGFIFICSDETMPEYLQRQLFGLPLECLEKVKAIRPGLPLFLYNSSTRCLHGVFEASCQGGLNLEPFAWKRSKPQESGKAFASKYPAQVRVCVRERRPSLDLERFKSALCDYDQSKFLPELSPTEVEWPQKCSEKYLVDSDWLGIDGSKFMAITKLSNASNFQAENLLKLFGCSNSKPKEGQDTYRGNKAGDFMAFMSQGLRPESDCFSVSSLHTVCSKNSQGRNLNIHQVESINCNGSGGGGLIGNGAPNTCFVSYRAALKYGMSASNASPKEEDCYTKGTSSENRGVQAQYAMLPSNFGTHSNGALESLRGRYKRNEPSWIKKAVANSQPHDSVHFLEPRDAIFGKNSAPIELDRPQCLVDSSRKCTENNKECIFSSKAGNRYLSRRWVTVDKGRKEDCEGAKGSVNSKSGGPFRSYETGGCKFMYPAADGLQRRLHNPDPAVNSDVPMLPNQKFTKYSDNKERGDLSKPQKKYCNQRYLYVESSGQQNQRSTSSSCKQNFKPDRSMQNSHLQCNNNLKIVDKHQQHKRQIWKQVREQQFPSLLSTTFYPAVPPVPPPVPWVSQIPSLHFPVPVSIHQGFYSSPPFSYSSEVGGDKRDDDTIQQDNWMSCPLVQPIYGSNNNTTYFSPLDPFLGGAEVNVHAIHLEILEFAHNVRPTAEVYLQVEAAVECVRKVVKCLWPEKDIEVFGSFATGLCLSHSDVDLVVIDELYQAPISKLEIPTAERGQASLIRVLADFLRECSWCEGLTTVESAHIPVIRLNCKPALTASEDEVSPLKVISIDITIQGRRDQSTQNENDGPWDERREAGKYSHSGGDAREFILEKLHQFPPLAPLVLLLKSYLHHRSLNNVYSGGLGSYSLSLMVVFYLERVLASAVDVPTCPATLKPVESLSSFSEDLSTLSSKMSTEYTSVSISTNLHELGNGGASIKSASNSSRSAKYCLAASNGSSKGETMIKRAKLVTNQLLRLQETAGSPNLGTLLIGFLYYFGLCIDFTHAHLVLQGRDGNAGGVFWQNERQSPAPLWIEDPLRPGVNVGAGSFAMCHVQAAFVEMLEILTIPLPNASDNSEMSSVMTSQKRPLPVLDRLFDTCAFKETGK